MQIFILAAAITLYFAGGRQWFPTLVMFLVMQFGAILGAWWGARMKTRIARTNDELPLKPR